MDSMLGFGVFLGLIPANLFTELVPYQDVDVAHPEQIKLDHGDFSILYGLTIIPLFFGVFRMLFFRRMWENNPSQYTVIQSDES